MQLHRWYRGRLLTRMEESMPLLGQQQPRQPWLAPIRSSLGFTQLTVAVAVFTDDVLYGIVLPVLPNSLEQRLGLPAAERQKWVSILLAVFGLTQVVFTFSFGILADRIRSRRPVFLFGFIALAAATTLLYVGNSLAMLVIGRAAQGVATAVVQTIGIPLIVDKSPPDQLAATLGVIGTSIATAVVIGPIVGGFLYRYAGYHAVFALSYMLLVVDVVLGLAMIEDRQYMKDPGHQKQQSDHISRSTCEAESVDGTDPSAVHHQHSGLKASTCPEPPAKPTRPWLTKQIPDIIWLLASPRILTCLAACFLNATLLTSFDSVVPLFVADTFAWNSDQQGLIFLTLCGGFFFAPLIGRLADKYGTNTITAAGCTLCAPSFAALQLIRSNTPAQQATFCTLLNTIGFSLALIHAPTMAEINHAVQAETSARPERYGRRSAIGQANSLRNCVFAGGIALGPLFAGFLRDRYGWAVMATVLGGVSAVGAPATFWGLGGRGGEEEGKKKGGDEGGGAGRLEAQQQR